MPATEHPMTQPPQIHNERIYSKVWQTPEEAAAEIERLMTKCEYLQGRVSDGAEELATLTRRLNDWTNSANKALAQSADLQNELFPLRKDKDRLDYLQSKANKGAYSLSIYRSDETVRAKIDAMMNPASSPYGPRIEDLKKTIREAQDELYILAGNSDV
jgi:hypothetical protein